MLYNNGKQHKKLFLNGKQIRTVYKDGVCIYPGIFDPIAILQSGYIWWDSYFNPSLGHSRITRIAHQTSLPTGISIHDISNKDPYRFGIFGWESNNTINWYSESSDVFANTELRLSNSPGSSSIAYPTQVVDIAGVGDLGPSAGQWSHFRQGR